MPNDPMQVVNSEYSLPITIDGIDKNLLLPTERTYVTHNIRITTSTPKDTVSVNGGDISGVVTASSLKASINTQTNNSGIEIITAGSAHRANILYNKAVEGWVEIDNETVAITEDTTPLTSTTYYLNGVTLNAPSTGTKYFDITVPNGNTTDLITFRFTVDSEGNTTVSEPA